MDSESQRVFFFFFRRLLSSKHQLQPRRREDLFLEIKSVFFYIIHILDRIQIRNQLMLKHHVKNLPCLLTLFFLFLFCCFVLALRISRTSLALKQLQNPRSSVVVQCCPATILLKSLLPPQIRQSSHVMCHPVSLTRPLWTHLTRPETFFYPPLLS